RSPFLGRGPFEGNALTIFLYSVAFTDIRNLALARRMGIAPHPIPERAEANCSTAFIDLIFESAECPGPIPVRSNTRVRRMIPNHCMNYLRTTRICRPAIQMSGWTRQLMGKSRSTMYPGELVMVGSGL